MKVSGNAAVALGCVAFGGVMFLVPYFSRKSINNIFKSDQAMTGSQMQRGMYMNYGSKDVGPYKHEHQSIEHLFVDEPEHKPSSSSSTTVEAADSTKD